MLRRNYLGSADQEGRRLAVATDGALHFLETKLANFLVAVEAHESSLVVLQDLALDPSIRFDEHHVAVEIADSRLYEIGFSE